MSDLDGLNGLDSGRRVVTQNLTADLDGLVPFLLGVADRLADGHRTLKGWAEGPCCDGSMPCGDHAAYYCPACDAEDDELDPESGNRRDPDWRCSSVRQAEGIRAMVARHKDSVKRLTLTNERRWPELWSCRNGIRAANTDALRILAGMCANMPGYRPEWGLG